MNDIQRNDKACSKPRVHIRSGKDFSCVSARDDWPVAIAWLIGVVILLMVLPFVLGPGQGILAALPASAAMAVVGLGCRCRIRVSAEHLVVTRTWLGIPYRWWRFEGAVEVQVVGTGDGGEDDGWPVGTLCEVSSGTAVKRSGRSREGILIGSRRAADALAEAVHRELAVHGWARGSSPCVFVSGVK